MACLDRIFVNQAWLTIFPHSHTYRFNRIISDHSPIYLDNGISHISSPHMFKFEAYWLNQEGFSDLMAKWWLSFPSGPLTSQIWKIKLEQLRLKLKGWNANLKRENRDKKHHFTSSITQYELLLGQRDLSEDKYISFFAAKNGLSNVYRDEVVYWQQCARLQWLSRGDANSKFFHSISSSRRRANQLTSLQIAGTEVRDPDVIKSHIFHYYKDLLGSKGSTWLAFSADIWEENEKVYSSENISLTAPFLRLKLNMFFFL
jgi:hypothetical protein